MMSQSQFRKTANILLSSLSRRVVRLRLDKSHRTTTTLPGSLILKTWCHVRFHEVNFNQVSTFLTRIFFKTVSSALKAASLSPLHTEPGSNRQAGHRPVPPILFKEVLLQLCGERYSADFPTMSAEIGELRTQRMVTHTMDARGDMRKFPNSSPSLFLFPSLPEQEPVFITVFSVFSSPLCLSLYLVPLSQLLKEVLLLLSPCIVHVNQEDFPLVCRFFLIQDIIFLDSVKPRYIVAHSHALASSSSWPFPPLISLDTQLGRYYHFLSVTDLFRLHSKLGIKDN